MRTEMKKTSKKAFKRAIGSLLKNGLIEKNGDYFILKK